MNREVTHRSLRGAQLVDTVNRTGQREDLDVAVSGKLTHDDYRQFAPVLFERLVKRHGKIRVLFEMTDFHGWTLPRCIAVTDRALGVRRDFLVRVPEPTLA